MLMVSLFEGSNRLLDPCRDSGVDLFVLFNVHRYNTRENNITKGNSTPLTGDKSTMAASMQVTCASIKLNTQLSSPR